MNLPPTLLSIIYHGTIARYRDEMHAHPDQAFDRFKITGSKQREACLAVDGAAFKLRSNPGLPAAQTELEDTSKVLFERLESVLAAEIANGVPGPNQPKAGSKGPDARLLTDLYRLMYSADFRAGNPGLPASLPGLLATVADQAAWDAVKVALDAGGDDFAKLLPHAKVLCNRMKAEFDEDIWTFIW